MSDEKTEKLKSALRDSLGDNASEELIFDILKTLDKQKVFRYHNKDVVSLLSTPGRVLCAVIEDNTMTLRALAVYLNMSETMIDKTIKSLVSSGLITKTKVNRQNVYKVHNELVLKHPDIQHLLGAINIQKSPGGDNDIF
jgi:DNA-binding HxlR family transcriptional regulator